MAKAVGQYTIADLTDGTNGKSAIQALLSNENHTLTADASGTPISYTGCSTTITVYEGTTDVTSQYTIARSAATGITTTISGSTITVTAVTNGVGGNVIITATKGSTVLTKVFTISVSKTGQTGQQGQTGQTGPAGADAKLVIINPSSQVFKSTTGATGTFSPQYIYLYPSFQGCSYSKWQYSTNGTSWTDVVSGQHSLTIGTYNSTANSLRIERTCDLYTSSVTAVTFRCASDASSVYDNMTILKLYDVTDIQVGARNFVLKSNVEKTSLNTITTYDISEFGKSECVGKTIMISFDIKASADVSGIACDCYLRSSNQQIISNTECDITNVTTDYKRYSFKRTVAGTLSNPIKWFALRTTSGSGGSSTTTFTIKNVKVEVGNVATTWTPAPEDLEANDILRTDEEPTTKTVGMLWFNTSDGTLQMWNGTQWVLQDVSQFITEEAVDNKLINKNKTWITQPEAPYYAGDIWTVQDGNDKGKIKTCLISRLTPVGSYNPDDWFTPLDAYTTINQMKNVIGKDPSEWSTESSSLTQLINENTKEIVGAKSQAAKLAVRASDIEMSFSRTGTMNFLGNSSCQNGFNDWTLNLVSNSLASQIKDDDLVAGYGFQILGNYNHWDKISSSRHEGNIYNIPPAGDFFVVSFKLKNQCKNSYVMIEAVPYDISNNRLDGGSSASTGWLKVIPYTEEASHDYVLFHFVADKNVVSNLKSVKIAVFFGKVSLDTSITTRPEWSDMYINTLIKEDSTYYFGKSSYQKMTIIESDEEPELTNTQVWKCTTNIIDENTNTYRYLAGFYYELDTGGNIVPVVDNYDITMLDKDNYYKIIGLGWVDVTNEVVDDVLQIDSSSPIQFGDIMFNGGQMVQTWTPRQDENLWGTNIKFNENGIILQSGTYRRKLNESSDIAWKLDSNGSIVSCIWRLTEDGFIAKDIKCYGTFFMGYVEENGDNSSTMETYFNSHKVLEMSKANDEAGNGINEYIYS